MDDRRFGPNTAQVNRFLDRLRRLTARDWEELREASPSAGSNPDLEVEQAPEYFKALQEATRLAKSNVFSGSESAFYDAMRTAQLVADASAFQPSTRPEPAGSAVAEDARLSPEAEAEGISRIMSTAYEEESWRRVMNACMVAAGALVVSKWLPRREFDTLLAPMRIVTS
ncbi:MAG TPA: hypothetical protein VFR68_00910 [Candidatus Dormibacteraeota bacterium]|nr:hypothetical protein [Candidatus Dormibacteraeota bacterium]